ncbi:MAG: DUF1499 domain-containing protein [Psychromonas sp.]
MSQRSSRIGTYLLIIAITALFTILIMMFGARLDLWEPIVGFGYIRNYLDPIAYSVFSLGMAGYMHQKTTNNRKGTIKALIATLIGLGLLSPMLFGKIQPATPAPAIHDITTDTDNPPVFLVLDETRAGAKNSLIYAGKKDADIQKKSYPDIAPIHSDLAAPDAFNKALNIAKEKGWEIVAQDPKAFRFEATARTLVFAFMDDVVVVVTPLDNTSRIDMRSVSRIGRSDKGVNAARISDFTRTFKQ